MECELQEEGSETERERGGGGGVNRRMLVFASEYTHVCVCGGGENNVVRVYMYISFTVNPEL